VSSLQGFNFDKEKLDRLLELFQRGQMSQEQVRELMYLLEQMHEEASNNGDLDRAREIASILMTLKGILGGRISFVENVPISDQVSVSVGKTKTGNLGRWPNETCKRCGKKNIRPEMSNKRWYYRRQLVCNDCLTKEQDEKAKKLRS
jgi:hypothetical protein